MRRLAIPVVLVALAVVLLAAVALFFNLNLGNANFLAALVILMISSLSFIGLGLIAAVLPLMSPEKGSQATHIFQAVLLLISGVYYETSILPGWLRPFSVISPATYTLRAMRAALLEGESLRGMTGTLLLLLVTGLLLIPLGLFVFHQAEIYAKKRGKLKRSG